MIMRFLKWFNKLFVELTCRHEWNHHVVNVQSEGSVKVLVLGWHDCKKCAASKIDFIFG